MSMSEHTLVELKAKADSLEPIRSRLMALNARHMGTLRQTDIYFDVPMGRLKLRQSDSGKETRLIYYERQDISRPKRSVVFVAEIPKSASFSALLKRILRVKATVTKTREIYWRQRTQIHLDTVDSLGYYVEFERETRNSAKEIDENVKLLERLMKTLEISDENLEKLSYADLVSLK